MMELSGYVLETLREGGEFILYRGRGPGHPSQVLVLMPAAEQPASASLKQLEHEYSLAAELDAAWAARPLALTRHDGRLMLVLEDPGGEPLDRSLGRPLGLTRFLPLAIGLVAALGQFHRRGLIHKDIKPSNLLVDDAGNVRLTGFGIASQLPRERQEPAPPEVIAGTLAYMAPEQTGRMNRSIDARSDLYSLGVTLYEMLTGDLPFAAADPIEWIHCHIAWQPMPPSERVKGIPDPVAAIVLKLLAKTAEERYQTAAGVEADLRRCLAEWESLGRIDPFPPGAQDVSDRLLIPEKLYGRGAEIDALVAAFDRVVTHGTTELVLVSGYSGIGKSSIVNELHKLLVPPRGLFAAGKFDQYKRDIPYATLAQAFQSPVRQLLSKNDAELGRWRDALQEALGQNGQLMVNLIPELALIIGEQPPVRELPPQDAQNRFQLVFRRFINVFARPEHPLALFLDDMQWLDTATLELLERLVTEPEVRHLLLVGAYRDNEVSASHPLTRTLEVVRNAGGRVQEIVLAPLILEDVWQLVADALRAERERVRPLAEVVSQKTGGNPFFAIQFMTALAEEGLLAFDAEGSAWQWDMSRIRAKSITVNVADLMAAKLSRLPAQTQEALGQLACLGNVAEISTVTLVQGGTEEELHATLWDAALAGLIFRQNSTYTFLHDRVHEAAYALIPESERAAAHLRIGRLFASRTTPAEVEEKIFEIITQFNRGSHLITSTEEREQVAGLNLIAGRRAKVSTAYASALVYLAAGRALLSEDSWQHNYDLAFALEIHTAECEFLTANMAAAEARLSMLAQRAKSARDIASVTSLRLTLYTTLDRSDRGVEVCLEYLRRCGTDWSPHPTRQEVESEYNRIWSQLGNRSIEELIELPLMTEGDTLSAMKVLAEVVAPALFTDENLACLVICRIVNLSLEHGNTDESSFGYVCLGMMAGPHFGNYQAGFRFGRLSYELVENRGLTRYQARIYMAFGNIVMPWTKHIRAGRDLLRRAREAANKTGDLTFAAYSCNNLNTNLIAAGDPLIEVQREAEHGLELAQRTRFGLVIDIITAQLGLIRTLRGLTAKFGSFNDEGFDELQFEDHLAGDSTLALPECWYWIRKTQAQFFAGDYVAAAESALKAQRLVWTSASLFETAEFHFYGALAHAACCDPSNPESLRQHYKALTDHHRQLEIWAENCPENFETRATLVSAEMARLEGRELDAMPLYERSIRSAHANGFAHNEALANELAARFYAERGFKTIADALLHNARSCYSRWGADGKVRQLDLAHAEPQDEVPQRFPAITIGASMEQLDFGTVVEVSQAMSTEILLDRLIERLMTITMQHTGADRALLIRPDGDELRIDAEAAIRGHAVTVRAPVASSALPDSVLAYVLRTKDTVMLDDASVANLFSDDKYFARGTVRSLLCLPLLRQGVVSAVLYLENSVASHVFTAARVEVLTLLAPQAAISLEIARLYREVQESEDRLRLALETIPAIVAAVRPDGAIEFVNRHGQDYTGVPFERIGQSWAAALHPKDIPNMAQEWQNALRTGEPLETEARVRRADGEYRWFLIRAVPLRDEKGNIVKWYVTGTDIEDRKQVEEIRTAQARQAAVRADVSAALSKPAHLGEILRTSAEAIVRHLDAAFARIWTLNKEQNILELQASVGMYTHLDGPHGRIPVGKLKIGLIAHEKKAHLTNDVLNDPRVSDKAWAKKEGMISFAGYPLIVEDRVIGVMAMFARQRLSAATLDTLASVADSIAQGIERKRAEEKIRQSEAYLAEAQRLSHTGSFGWSVSNGEIFWSEETFRIFECDQAVKPTLELVLQRVHPEDIALVQQTIDRASHDRTDWDLEHRLLMPDGSVKYVHVVTHAVKDESGKLESIGAVSDVTERKRAEEELRESERNLRLTQVKLEHATRVMTMGELVASIAHEVNQPLGAIVTNGQACVRLLSREAPDLDKSREVIGRMISDGMRASEVIRRIRNLLYKTPPKKAPLNINEIIFEVVALVSNDMLSSKVELSVDLAADLPRVEADRVQLQQVMLNLILNARDAMSTVQGHPHQLLIQSRKSESGSVAVAVRDSGCGLEPEDAERIFDPFFTTKTEGMGLGLSISRTIIEAHGGALWAAQNEDRGATIQFTVPLSSGSDL